MWVEFHFETPLLFVPNAASLVHNLLTYYCTVFRALCGLQKNFSHRMGCKSYTVVVEVDVIH